MIKRERFFIGDKGRIIERMSFQNKFRFAKVIYLCHTCNDKRRFPMYSLFGQAQEKLKVESYTGLVL